MKGTQAPRLVLVRHEESQANAALAAAAVDDFFYSVPGSDPEIGLTETGLIRSEELGRLLSAKFPVDQPITRAISSTYFRTTVTRDAIVSALPYTVETSCDSRLNKRSYGDFWNLTYKGVQKLFPQEYSRYLEEGPLNYRPPGGENYPDLFQRTDAFAETSLASAEGTLLIVTHLVVMLSFMRKFEAVPDHEIVQMYEDCAIPNGQIVIYSRAPDGQWHRELNV